MHFHKPITEIIAQRYSCRTYKGRPIEAATRQRLDAFLASLSPGRFGAPLRLRLLAAVEGEQNALRGLGTYGIIRGATGFLVGAVGQGPKNMVEFGYALEHAVLLATDLGLGTCWLGGTFTRSSFAARLELRAGEAMPAVASVGYIADKRSFIDSMMRRGARSTHRMPWEQLFFDGRFGAPLVREQAGQYATPLEMLRLAPSASNKQPWRVVRDGSAWHVYLQRTPGYGQIRVGALRVGDLQRVDVGIAMCDWELTAQEAGLPGDWTFEEPALQKPDEWTEYVATWR